MTDPITASCTCGNVTFTASAPPVVQFLCHCTDCRAATGNSHTRTAIFAVQTAQVSGAVSRMKFVAGSGATTFRDACRDCGTVMFDISEQFPSLIGVMADCLNAPFEFSPAHHIWLQSRIETFALTDGLEQHQRGLFEP